MNDGLGHGGAAPVSDRSRPEPSYDEQPHVCVYARLVRPEGLLAPDLAPLLYEKEWSKTAMFRPDACASKETRSCLRSPPQFLKAS